MPHVRPIVVTSIAATITAPFLWAAGIAMPLPSRIDTAVLIGAGATLVIAVASWLRYSADRRFRQIDARYIQLDDMYHHREAVLLRTLGMFADQRPTEPMRRLYRV